MTAAERRAFSGVALKAPAASAQLPAIAAAVRCTAPMNAPSPPPIMPKRTLLMILGSQLSHPDVAIMHGIVMGLQHDGGIAMSFVDRQPAILRGALDGKV